MKRKTLWEKWDEDILVCDPETLILCKTCKFRDKVYSSWDKELKYDNAYKKLHCQVYGKDSVLKYDIMIPYLPIFSESKPSQVDHNKECKYYQKETRSVEETFNLVTALEKRYKEEYAKAYKPEELHPEDGVPKVKDKMKELIVWNIIKNEFPEMNIKLDK